MTSIEQITKDNYRQIAQLAHEMWPHTTLEEELVDFKRVIDAPEETAFLYLIENRPVAFAYLKLRHDWVEGTDTYPVCYLEGIYVKEEARGSGIGQQLVDRCIIWGLEMGCKEMGSDAEIDNLGSIEFHKKMGFKEANRVVCFARKIG